MRDSYESLKEFSFHQVCDSWGSSSFARKRSCTHIKWSIIAANQTKAICHPNVCLLTALQKKRKKKTQRKFDFLIFWQSHELKFEFGIRTKQTVAVRGFENWCKNMWVNGKDKHIDTCRHIKIRRHKRITQKLYLSQREQKLNWFSVLAR